MRGGILEIMDTFSKDDESRFISYLKEKNQRGDVKNMALFKMLLKGHTSEIDQKLYGKSAKNALHALSKRLYDAMVDFTATKSFAGETSEELEILKLLLAGRIFFEHGKNKIAFKVIEKAQKKAMTLDAYAILAEIYYTKIQFSHLNPPKNNLTEIIDQANSNLVYFQKEQRLNMVYARIKDQQMNQKGTFIGNIIENVFQEFNIEIDGQLSYNSLYQITTIATTAATLQSDYHKLKHFLGRVQQILEEKKDTADKNLYYKIQLLNLLAYSSFRNRDIKRTRLLITTLEEELQKGYAGQFSEKVILLKGLVANFTGCPNEAISILDSQKENSLEAMLALAMCYFQQQEKEQAYTIIKKMHHTDGWYIKKAGIMWVLKKNLMELLLLIDLDKLDIFILKLNRFKRNYGSVLKELEEERVLMFISLITRYYENPKQVTTDAFRAEMEHMFNWKAHEEEDIYVMSFYAWLKAKMERRDVYEVTLELANA